MFRQQPAVPDQGAAEHHDAAAQGLQPPLFVPKPRRVLPHLRPAHQVQRQVRATRPHDSKGTSGMGLRYWGWLTFRGV